MMTMMATAFHVLHLVLLPSFRHAPLTLSASNDAPAPRTSEVVHRTLKRARHPSLKGEPLSPQLDDDVVLVRYMYEGGVLSQGRLTTLVPSSQAHITGADVCACLEADGVDLTRFYPCIYESLASTGAWLPLDGDEEAASRVRIALPPSAASANGAEEDGTDIASRRVDVKLCVRSRPDAAAQRAISVAEDPPAGELPISGYCAIGVVNTKNQANVGTLWRSAYQLGCQFLFTVGTRYRQQPTDTVRAIQRLPLFELDSWSHFVEFAPRGAKWVAVEMGGTPLEDFEHPLDAVYLLGSEDAGLPTSVLRACHEVVTLRSEHYASYNVAIAGSLVLYDRQQKARLRRESHEQDAGDEPAPPTQ